MPVFMRVLRCPCVVYGGELWPRGYPRLETRPLVGQLFLIQSPSGWLRDYQLLYASSPEGRLYRLSTLGQYYGIFLFDYTESRAQILLGRQYEVVDVSFQDYDEFLRIFNYLMLLEVLPGDHDMTSSYVFPTI